MSTTPYGENGVTFTATVRDASSGSSGTPTGTVQFLTNGVNFGSAATLSGGSASSASLPLTLPVGNYTVTAVYSGDSDYTTSAGTLSGGQTVNLAASSTSVVSSSPLAVYGEGGVAWTATVIDNSIGSSGTPTGTVQFETNNVAFGSPVTLSGGVAVLPLPLNTPVGSYHVEAVYSGDANYNMSSGTYLFGQRVSAAASSTTVTSSSNPSVYGQSGVTFTATVSDASNGSTGTPTGTVQFQTNGVNFGSAVTLSGGSASTAALPTTLAEGGLTVTAAYGGDGDFSASSGTLSGGQTVIQAVTSTAVQSSSDPSAYGQSGVVFTATVTSASSLTATGTVQFKLNGADFGIAVALSGGSATSPAALTPGEPPGNYVVTAVYSGDLNFTASIGTLSGGQTVNSENSATAVASSSATSVYGQSGVTFTATVSGFESVTPTGTVQFLTNGTSFGGAVTLSGGSASLALPVTMPAGNYTVVAAYSGDSIFTASSGTLSGGQTVNLAASSTAVVSSSAPSASGQSGVTFTATVSDASSASSGTPTGTVQFKTNGVNFGSAVTLSGGSASSVSLPTTLAAGHLHGNGGLQRGSRISARSSGTLSGGQTVNQAASSTTRGFVDPIHRCMGRAG